MSRPHKPKWYEKKVAQADFYKIDWSAIGGAIVGGIILLGILGALMGG